MTVILGVFSGPSLLSFQLSTSLPPSVKSNPHNGGNRKQRAMDGCRDGGRRGQRQPQSLPGVHSTSGCKEKIRRKGLKTCMYYMLRDYSSLFLHEEGKRGAETDERGAEVQRPN